MPKNDSTETASAAPETTPADEPRNVAIRALKDRTKIGKAIVAAGRVDFPVTLSEAKALKEMGLVEIEGLFA